LHELLVTLLQHLNSLLENYLEPLKKETFLSNAEINALFGNIQEIVAFQRQFLQNLDEALDMEPEFHNFEHPGQFKVHQSHHMLCNGAISNILCFVVTERTVFYR
jgi:hypothetical protein